MDKAYGFLLERTAKKLKQELQKQFNQLDVNITVDQWMILYELHEMGELSLIQLGELTCKDSPTITRMIRLLESRNIIVRKPSPSDKRKQVIILSKTGEKMVSTLMPTVHAFRNKGWQGLSKKDTIQLERIISKIDFNFNSTK